MSESFARLNDPESDYDRCFKLLERHKPKSSVASLKVDMAKISPKAAIAAGRLIYRVPAHYGGDTPKPATFAGNLPEAPVGFAWIMPGAIPPTDSVFLLGDGRQVSFAGLIHREPTRGPVKYAGDAFFSGLAQAIK